MILDENINSTLVFRLVMKRKIFGPGVHLTGRAVSIVSLCHLPFSGSLNTYSAGS